jgi:type I restriction enzyme M protein
LNIPRYVDTFEEEEAIDLAAVSVALKQVNSEMEQTDKTIADFCEQLGIEPPF